NCGRRFQWRDAQRETGTECRYCRWMVSDSHSFCPWCGREIRDADSSPEPLKAPKGFLFHKRCKRCRGGLMYPMQWCPWCGRSQAFTWGYYQFQNICPHCDRGVDDWMDTCPWCGKDATGRDLLPRALRRVHRLLVVSRLKAWHYLVLLRPGVSGVSPDGPKVIEIDRRYVRGKRRSDEVSWNMLTGLILHELGHSFLYHHWSWTRSGRFRRAFGEVRKAYRVADEHWVDFERRRVATTLVDYVSAYASTHPHVLRDHPAVDRDRHVADAEQHALGEQLLDPGARQRQREGLGEDVARRRGRAVVELEHLAQLVLRPRLVLERDGDRGVAQD